jgi:3'-5' exoribonuclease
MQAKGSKVNDYHSFLVDVACKFLPENLKQCCLYVLEDNRFQSGMGGSLHHHNYQGGLVEHTAEVVQWIMELASKKYNLPVLITAAIWHDFHKIYEYQWNEEKARVDRLTFRSTIGHVTGSALEFYHTAMNSQVASETIEEILHCMLSHHGRHEWGSPVEPTTPEAWLLHSADMLSSRGKKLE